MTPPHFLDRGDGVRLAYRHRAGTGATCVFLPGYMSDMDGTKAQALDGWAATTGAALLRLDYSGCGASEGDFAHGSISRWRDDALAVINHVTTGAVLLIGSSMGAWVALLVSGIALAALGMILFLAGHPRAAGRFTEHDNWMRFIGAVHVGLGHLRKNPRAAVGVMVTALVYQVSVVVTVGFVILTLGVDVPVASVIAFIPVVAMAQVVPISLSGLGVREGMLVLLFHPLGVPNGRAIGIGLLWYLVMLLVSLLGAPAFAVGQRAQKTEDVSPHA